MSHAAVALFVQPFGFVRERNRPYANASRAGEGLNLFPCFFRKAGQGGINPVTAREGSVSFNSSANRREAEFSSKFRQTAPYPLFK